jgi:hypothetical protein
MSKPWKCRIGWHAYVRQAGHDDPSHQICLRCQKKTGYSVFGGGAGRFG